MLPLDLFPNHPLRNPMSKILAIMIAGFFAAGAYAQAPKGASSESSPIMNSKPQERAEAKVDARPQGKVKAVGGDTLNTPEGGAIGTGKAAAAGQAREATRNAKRPNRKVNPQGGTPQ
ncbi:cell envelope biogenesis protein TolA [Variovorax saccharolyticus]|uniref:cell envelope biogenesis protein TolA n=1 Tax=Variovorax saccharolyticus TaxID=3053516 RepID=UPI002577913E|nr:cell envelope biogenesis protein TolA [Variovorax sp. J31P216]MDM0025878.1 cell envelope biogenesis protein TolA [Variovorax sp. J31P216]